MEIIIKIVGYFVSGIAFGIVSLPALKLIENDIRGIIRDELNKSHK